MSAFTYPGVYIEELSGGVHTITGVATSIAAFVGWAPQGPVSEATLVESWAQYEAIFGGFDYRSKLGYAVNQFFANGGQQAYIVRLVWDGSVPAASGTNPVKAATAVATGVGYASTQITAASGSVVSPPATLFVGTPVLQSIAITPGNLPPIPINATGITFTATGKNSDGSQTNLTASATWTSSNPSVISVAAGGVATPNGPGTATITATGPTGLISGSITVTVTAASLSATTGIKVTPGAPTLDSGQTQQFAATATYSDQTTHDITAIATWTPGGDFSTTTPGLFTPTTVSGYSVNAAWAGSTSTPGTSVTVVAAAPVSLIVSRVAATMTKGTTQVFNAEVVNSDGTTTDVSATASWGSSNTAVAKFTAGNTLSAVGVGSATITATSGSFSASTTVIVTAASLKSIAVSPAAPTIAKGQSLQLKATGVYDDGSTADLTGCADWTTGNAAIVSVTPLLVTVTNGVVTLSNGSINGVAVTGAAITITATFEGQSGTAAVSVTNPVLLSIDLSPKSKTILSGQTWQFHATGTYSDTSTLDITNSVTWASLSPGVAAISATGLAAASSSVGGSLNLFANNPGAWGNNLRVTVTVPNPNPNNRFNLLVQEVNPNTGAISTLESFVNLSVSPTDPQYVGTVVDNDSNYITLLPPGATPPPPVPVGPPSAAAGAVALSGGADGAVLTPASDQNFELVMLNDPLGVYLLQRVDIFNLLCVPGETDAVSIQTLQAFCFHERAFYIVDAPQTATHASLQKSGPTGTPLGSGTSITGTGSQNSAYYFPWVLAPDPLFGNRPTLFPPCGFVAGIYAATDAGPGVWKAPAGINTALTGASGLQYVLTDVENGDLNTQAINCLRQFKVYGDVVWGARTLQGNDQAGSEWKYIPIRRLALYIESSLYDGTQWVVFEPNDEKLWGQIRMNVGAFMQGLFLKGAFQGTSPQKAYFVKCDSENNPQSSIDLGIVNITVGFAPLFPAEFVVIQIVQMAGQSL